jgi:hypothetical protein
MKFEELLKTDIDDLSDEQIDEITQKMDISQLKKLETKVRKTTAVKKKKQKRLEKALSKLDDLIAMGLSNDS